MIRAAALALCLVLPVPAAAHPHVFVDTGFELVFDGDGRLAAIRTAWVYDAFFSLLVIEDGGHDADRDGAISATELPGLSGFDMDWPVGFDGDVAVVQGGTAATLRGPEAITVDWREGRLISTHLRRLDRPLDPAAGDISISPYDPTYYTAYTIVTGPRITGRGDCRTETRNPDLDAADLALRDALAALPPDADAEAAAFPAVGALFAQELRVACGG